MNKKKTLKELTLKDNFMFGAVMSKEENCRRLLELILQFPIEKVEVSKEKSLLYHPEYKGIRMDVYAKDDNNTHYNVEMQTVQKTALGRRARYYHSQIDMELLLSGEKYEQLPNTYVIFICDFDPFGMEKYCYTFENKCEEISSLTLSDGSKSIFLNTHGKNENEVPEAMVKFLKYVKADLAESVKDFEDEFVRSIQDSVQHVKESREMEEKFMILHEMLEEEREEGYEAGWAEGMKDGIAEGMKVGIAAGRAEGRVEGKAEGKAESIIELLQELGTVTEELQSKIIGETDISVLAGWLKLAAKAETIEQFQQNM